MADETEENNGGVTEAAEAAGRARARGRGVPSGGRAERQPEARRGKGAARASGA